MTIDAGEEYGIIWDLGCLVQELERLNEAIAATKLDIERSIAENFEYYLQTGDEWQVIDIACKLSPDIVTIEMLERATRVSDQNYWPDQMRKTWELRRMPYAQYLQTDHWQEVRKAAIKRAGYRCEVCNSFFSLQVHHRTYVNRGKERGNDLITLCSSCHKMFHDNDKLAKE